MLASGCWSDDELIDGAFTPDQWARLQAEFRPPAMDPCAIAGFSPAQQEQCAAAIDLGGQLFTDQNLSSTKTVSCQTCHVPSAGWIDPRMPNEASQGASGATTRNSMTILNVGYKVVLAQQAGTDPRVFTWRGGSSKSPSRTGAGYERPGDVLELAEDGNPLGKQDHMKVAYAVRNNSVESELYQRAFSQLAVMTSDDALFTNLERALDAYLSTIVTNQTPFDLWLSGQDSPMTDSAKRGFAVFVGRGTCISCHRGYLFSDLEFHDTGVPQTTSDPDDVGRADVTKDPADTGKFITGTLREIASTGPYFHNGCKQSLGDVIDFYRQGGTPDADGGQKDPRIQPLELSDQDAQDLQAFLESLTQCDGTSCPALGAGSGSGSGSGMPPPDAGCTAMDGNPGTVCSGTCVDLQFDPTHCGSCGDACMPGMQCVMGHCSAPACSAGLTYCPLPTGGGSCYDLQSDPASCGTCFNACAPGAPCVMGQCAPAACPPDMQACPAPGGGPLMCVPIFDPMNCGSCGNVCPANESCTPTGTCM